MDNQIIEKCDRHFMLLSDDVCLGFISGRTFEDKPVQYSVVDGLAIFEGDIVLGTVEEIESHTEDVQATQARKESGDDTILYGIAISGRPNRWPLALIPYEIDSNFSNKDRIRDAIAHWEERTNIRFVQRTSSNANQYPNFLYFRLANGCWSFVGIRGGGQDVGLHKDCEVGDIIHQIGHAYGLWHEQSRYDRDAFIKINWENIIPGYEHNFNQHLTDGDDCGPYDYDSIMHFPATAFSRNNLPTIEALHAERAVGHKTHLSNGDIAAVYALQVKTEKQQVSHHEEIERAADGGASPSATEKQRASRHDETDIGIDDAFWLAQSENMIRNAIPAQDKAAETLQKSVAWFWTVYSAAVVIGATLTQKNYPIWVIILLALPSPILILAYFFAGYVGMPDVVAFNPRYADQIRDEHQRVLKHKRKLLRIALLGTLLAAILVAIAVVASSTIPG